MLTHSRSQHRVHEYVAKAYVQQEGASGKSETGVDVECHDHDYWIHISE